MDFIKRPLKMVGNTVYLEENQKLDILTDFKGSFDGVDIKEWEVYPKMAKRLKFIC
jgi:hypothetical protein